MTVQIHTWESNLLTLAQEARHSVEPTSSVVVRDEEVLEHAYAHCQDLIAFHSRSFCMASSLLPANKRQAVRAPYAFCRTADDLVDLPTDGFQTALATWRERVLASHGPSPIVWYNRYHGRAIGFTQPTDYRKKPGSWPAPHRLGRLFWPGYGQAEHPNPDRSGPKAR